MKKLAALTLSVALAGCTLGKFQDSPEKEVTLDGYPMSLRVVHEGAEFEIKSQTMGIYFMPDTLQFKRRAIAVADAEAAAICGQKKPHLLDREKPEGAAYWLSLYRCNYAQLPAD